jgi:PAS domain S-box-containing protein
MTKARVKQSDRKSETIPPSDASGLETQSRGQLGTERGVEAESSPPTTHAEMPLETLQGTEAPPVKMRKKLAAWKVTSEEDLKHDNAFLAAIVRSSEDAIIGMDLDGNIQSWNQGSERMFGYSADEVMGKSVNIIYPPEHEEELSFIVAKMRKGESINHYETHRKKRDGTVIDVSLCFSPIRDDNGEIIGMAKIVRDFTGQRTASQYARRLIEAIPDPLVTISPEGKITDVNEATVQATGVSRVKLIGTDFSMYFTSPEKAWQAYQQVFSKGKVIDYPLTIRHRGGKNLDVLYHASVYKDNKGKVLGVFAAARDVTALKQASQYARSLIEASLDPLVTISPEGKIMDVNEATVKITGVAREELIGSDFSNYFTEPKKAREGYEQVFKKGFVTDYALTLRSTTGKLTDVLYNASVYKDDKGEVLGVFAAARDVTETKQASQYARSLIEASLDPLVTISPEGKIMDVNAATVEITGVARENLIGSEFSSYFTEPEEAQEGYQQVLQEGFVRDFPLAIRHVSGTVTDVLYNATLYKDVFGKVQGIFAAARDITVRKRMEEQLHATSAYARSLIEASLDPLVTISPEGKITDVNHATELITGVSREWLIGTDFSNYFTEPRKARQGYRQAFKEGSVRDYPLAMRHSSGNVVDVLYNATVYRDAQGKIRGVFAAARDVTETRKASQYARSLIDASLDPLVTISPEGKITDVNEATISVTGVPRERLIGTDFSNYFTEPDKARAGYEQVFQQGFVTDYALTIRHASGKMTDVLYNASVYKDDKGNVLGVFAAARDYSRVKQTTQQLEASNRELEAFSYSVSHDLRAPLRSIDGFSQALLEDYACKLDDQGKQYLHFLRKSSQEMAELIDDMLQLSQLSRGKLNIKDNVDLSQITRQIAKELAEEDPERKVEFIIEDGLAVKGDARLLRAALQNLLDNAWKFTSKHPTARIEFGASLREGKRTFFVKDNGAGFDMAFAGKLFGVFQRLHGKEEFPGTGIGLATAQRIINRHGGKIWAEGEPEKGAAFYFTLD